MLSTANVPSVCEEKSAVRIRGPCWVWPIRLPASACRAAYRFAGLAGPVCQGWRWVPLALSIGTFPFLVSYALGVPGHQAASAMLLVPLCLNCVREDAWAKGISIIALAFVAHSALVIALANTDPQNVAPLLPDAGEYWQKQILWIQTGSDPEYQLSAWVPAHLQLLGGAVLYSYASLGGVIFYEGFYEVDLMNFYTAQLLRHSSSPMIAFMAGWHIWSLLRGLGYLLITFEVLSLSLHRMIGTALPVWRRRRWRWATGLSFILADGLLKGMLLDTVREQLFTNLN